MLCERFNYLPQGRGVLRISGDVDDRLGQKEKPKKIPRASNKTPKKSLDQNLIPKKSHAEFTSHLTVPESINWYNTRNRNISIEYPPKSLLYQATEKNTCQNFPTPKNTEIENFKPPKNPWIIPVTWNPEYPPPPPSYLEANIVLFQK